MPPYLIHIVISLDPGGLERLVVDWANARNHKWPGSTMIICLDHLGLLADQVAEGAVICINAHRKRFPWDRDAVERMREVVRGKWEEGRGKGQAGSEKWKVEGGKTENGKSSDVRDQRTEDGNQRSEYRGQRTEDNLPALRPQPSALILHPSPTVVLHAHNLAAWQYAMLSARGSGARVLYTQHGVNRHNHGLFDRLRVRWLTRHTHAIVTVSATTADAMFEKQGIPRKRITVIPNGIAVLTNLDCAENPLRKMVGTEPDPPECTENALFSLVEGRPPCRPHCESGHNANCRAPVKEELRRELQLPVAGFVVGSVGRFAPEKNYPLLVGAFAAFHRRHPDSCLVLVGDGPERGAIETAIRMAGIESACRLPGMQSAVAPWLQAMDLFCLTSSTEGISVALLEAGAYGVPAVATAVGGNVEIIEDGVTGLLVDPGSHPSVTDAFERLHGDSDLRLTMGKMAREKVAKNYSQQATLDMYERLYGEG